MKLFTAVWNENGRAGQKSFLTVRSAREFAAEKVQSEDCSPVAVWRYDCDGPIAGAMVKAHDRAEWWDEKTYVGTQLKRGSWTSR